MKKALLLCIGVFLACGSANGVDFYWTNPATSGSGRDWETASNWDQNAVPGAGDRVFILNGGQVTGTGNYTVGELTVDNGSDWEFNSGYYLTVTDDCGTSGDFRYLSTDAPYHYHRSWTLDVAGNFEVSQCYYSSYSHPTYPTKVILRGENKEYRNRAYDHGYNFGMVEMSSSYFDNGSRGSYTNTNTLLLRSSAQILPNPSGSSEWQFSQFIFEGGQSNLPAYGANVNFDYNCHYADNGVDRLAVTGGVTYPQDVRVGSDYWSSSAAPITPIQWKTTGGDIKVGRDFLITNLAGNSSAIHYLNTADNDGGSAANLTVGRDFKLPTSSTTEVYGVKLNDSTVRAGRNVIFGASSSAYYSWAKRNPSRVDLGSATIHVGQDFKVYRMRPEAVAAWNAGTSTIICDGNGTGGTGGPGWPYYDRQNIRLWGSESPLCNFIVDTTGTVRLDNYQYGDAAGGDNMMTSVLLTGDLEIRNGTFNQNNVPITFNGPDHLLQDDVGTDFDDFVLLSGAVVNLGSDIVMDNLEMGASSAIYLNSLWALAADGFTYDGLNNTGPGGAGPWSNDGGTIYPGVIPEPGTMLLIGTGILGLLGYIRRRRMK